MSAVAVPSGSARWLRAVPLAGSQGAFDPASEGIVLKYLQALETRNMSALTIGARRCALARLARMLDGPVLYATHEQLTAWQTERAKTLSPATRRCEISNVKAFYRWALIERFIAEDPTDRLGMPRVPRRMPRPIPDDRLLHAMRMGDDRMRAILGLAAFAGLRAKEIARLDWSEVDLEAKQPLLLVNAGKGGHQRIVPLSTTMVEILRALPHNRGPVIARFDNKAGCITPNSVSKRASWHLQACGIDERLHAGRHRFATAAYRATLDIRAVQELLGHSSPITTAIYAKASDGAVAAAAEAAGELNL